MPMSAQSIFNKVATHLLTQNKQATDEFGHCQYRGDKGTKCAIGCLIPDDVYNPDMEGSNVYGICKHFPSVKHLLGLAVTQNEDGEDMGDNPKTKLCYKLQDIHDEHETKDWRRLLKCVAKEFDLDATATMTERAKARRLVKAKRSMAAKKAWKTRTR